MAQTAYQELLDTLRQQSLGGENWQETLGILGEEINLLADSLDLYSQLFEFAPDGYFTTDAQGIITLANRSAVTLLGGQTVGKNLLDFVAIEAKDLFQRLLGQLHRGTNIKTIDLRMQVPESNAETIRDTQNFEATLTIKTIRDPLGRVTGFRWWIQDTTERQQDEILLRRAHQQQELRQAELQTKLGMLDRQMRLEREEHRRTAHSLARSEAKLKALLQYSTDIVYIIDLNTGINFCSPAINYILGYLPDEVIDKKFVQFIHPDDLNRLHELLARLVSAPIVSMPIVLRHRHANGDWIYMESVCNNLLQDVNVQGIVINSRDITERRRAESALLESELRLGAIASSMPGTFYRLKWQDTEISLPYISDGLIDMVGMSPSQAMANPKKLLEIIHPEDREQVKAMMYAAKERPATFRREFRIITKMGEIKWVQDIARYYKDSEGHVLADGVCMDITERGDAETELQRLNELLQAIIRTAPVAIDLITPDQRTLLWNPAAESLLGWSVAEVLERESPIPAQPFLTDTLGGQAAHNLEVQYQRKDQTPIDVSLTTSSVRDGEGKLVGVLRIMADISDRLRAQTQLQRESHAFHQVANSSPDWVVRFDPKLRFIYANSSIASAMGFVPATFLGKTARELGISEALTVAWEEALIDVLRTGLPREIPLTYAHRQEVWHYTAQVSPELDKTGEIKSLLCIARLQNQHNLPQFGESNPREESLTSALLLRYFAQGRRNFAGANLRGVKLSHAILPGIDLSGAQLNGGDFSQASLENACLRGADLRGANFQGAILIGADLRGADLKGTDLRDVQGLDVSAL